VNSTLPNYVGGVFNRMTEFNFNNNLKEYLFDKILPFVSKPGRYIGNEVNMSRKELRNDLCRIALVFPDVYEVGMSYNGFPILYNILNKKEGMYAERAFAPWNDMEEQMRANKLPLFSLETFSPLASFDIIGFTFQYELFATSIVNLIDLSGLPIKSRDRKDLPLIVLGGPSIYNPEPMADFIDVAVIGDGEDIIVEIAEIVQSLKLNGEDRKAILKRLCKVKGVYVPEFYEPIFSIHGDFDGLKAVEKDAPRRIKARTVEELATDNYPTKPLVPMIGTTHDRVSLEIARGCSRGCRFCNAGFVYRPVRERSVEDLVRQALDNIDSTGYDEISLVSLSTSDYTNLTELMGKLNDSLGDKMVNLSFPSLRPESFTEEVAFYAKGVRKSGLTLAPEAGSQRLRDIINKATSEESLLKAVDLAFKEGWKSVKLYFMIGQPDENDLDLEGIIDLIEKVAITARKHHGKKVNVSISPFVPKPLTPFQWVQQNSMAETESKLDLIKRNIKARNVKLSWRNADIAAVEGILARGDRRLCSVIKKAWELGARLDGWSENFDFERWNTAVSESEFTFEKLLGGFSKSSSLPWDHINKGITKKFLKDEYSRAKSQNVTPDCRFTDCSSCGLMGETVCKEIINKPQVLEHAEKRQISNTKNIRKGNYLSKQIIRIEYGKGEHVRYLSHLDMMRMFERAMRRAQVPLAYTEGFNPRPKISYGPALATGYTSESEFMDVHIAIEGPYDIKASLSPHLPLGIEIKSTKKLVTKSRSLTALIDRLDYDIYLDGTIDQKEIDTLISELLSKDEIIVKRLKKGKDLKVYNIRPSILQMTSNPRGLSLQSKIFNGLSVRAEEILRHLLPGQETLIKTAKVNRTNLFISDGDKYLSPLDH
jgi:radical SAM family uncharacterized protein/radical SAM-linked protein